MSFGKENSRTAQIQKSLIPREENSQQTHSSATLCCPPFCKYIATGLPAALFYDPAKLKFNTFIFQMGHF